MTTPRIFRHLACCALAAPFSGAATEKPAELSGPHPAFPVSLVCEADDHTLKRTVPIFEDRPAPGRGVTVR